MYSILLKKNKGDIFPYPLNDIIEKYIKAFGSNDIILAIPGYQSTTQNRIDTLCDELRRIAPNNDIYILHME